MRHGDPPQFRLTIQTEQASLYFQAMPPMPAPRTGEDVFVPGEGGMGWWRVKRVDWRLPSMQAMTPTMEVCCTVEWSPLNREPAPIYDEDRGWVQAASDEDDA